MMKKIRFLLLAVMICSGIISPIFCRSSTKTLLAPIAISIELLRVRQLNKTVQWVRDTARKHQSKKVSACTSLQMIEQLLRSDEQRAIKKIQKIFNIPDEAIQDYCARMEIIKKDAITCYKTPIENIVHDPTIPEYIMAQVKYFLKQADIDPQAVNILSDAEYFAVNSGHIAYTRDPYTYDQWRGQNYFKQGTIMFGVNLKV